MLRRISSLLVLWFVLVACSSPANTSTPGTQTPVSSANNVPDWTKIILTDARTGKAFTLADFAGKTVFVEPMATWCTNCRAQLPSVEAARLQLNSDQYVFVGLSVAENVDNPTLAKYVDDHNWKFIFAVAPDALSKAMVDVFGRTAITPPSTPHFIIRPNGSMTQMTTGFHSPDELVAEIKAAAQG
jgi:thiol-disulfide isomerase/thioredoxin